LFFWLEFVCVAGRGLRLEAGSAEADQEEAAKQRFDRWHGSRLVRLGEQFEADGRPLFLVKRVRVGIATRKIAVIGWIF
jgi:hypothetical protein